MVADSTPTAHLVRTKEPPGPPGLPLLGSLVDIARDPLGFLENSARRHGDVVKFNVAGWPVLLLSHPDQIEDVLLTNAGNFIKNQSFWQQVKAIFGNGLLTSEGPFWRRQRHLAAPAFAGARVKSYGRVMVDLTERMLDSWSPGEPRNVHSDMMALTLRIAAKTFFDAELEEDVADIEHAIGDMTAEIRARFARPFVIPDALPLPGHIRYRRGIRLIEKVVDRLLQDRRANPGDRGDLLSMLLQATDESGMAMTERQLRDEMVTLLLAGHETTALALSWTLMLLAQHPEEDEAIWLELRNVLGGRGPMPEDLPKLRHVGHVIGEAMRLYPPAWAIGRQAIADCEIGGYGVRRGTTIYVSPWVVHRDARFFEDPLVFRPARWEDEAMRGLPRFAYFPFGGGPRICIGKSFAMMEATLILAAIMQRFSVRMEAGRSIKLMPSITLRPKTGVFVTLQPRGA